MKPIGAFLSKDEADRMVQERDYQVIEDAGRGWRRMVASPKPRSIVEIASIRDMVDADLSYENVIKTTCFLADMGDFGAFNSVYEKFFVYKPARSCMVEAIAAV